MCLSQNCYHRDRSARPMTGASLSSSPSLRCRGGFPLTIFGKWDMGTCRDAESHQSRSQEHKSHHTVCLPGPDSNAAKQLCSVGDSKRIESGANTRHTVNNLNVNERGREYIVIANSQVQVLLMLSNQALLLVRRFPMSETGRHPYSWLNSSGGNLDERPTDFSHIYIPGRFTAIIPAFSSTGHHRHGGSFRDQTELWRE